MAQINKPGLHFNTKLFTGTNGSGQSITGVGFRPDWVWIKHRTDVSTHRIQDVVRGSTKIMASNSDAAESTSSNSVTSFDSDGFTHGTNSAIDATGNVVAWNWKAGGAGSANTDGDITSSVSANTTAGFSIVSWTSNGSQTDRVGHGLSDTPKIIFYKSRTSANGAWYIWINQLVDSSHDYLVLNGTNAKTDINTSTYGTPSSTTFSNFGFANSENMIAYCFAEKKGYSKFGKYIGNGNADGAFIYTGFKPAWVMGKRTDTTNNWYIFDSVRDPHNLTQRYIRPDTNSAEINNSSKAIDIYSNGFKIKNSDPEFNASGGTYIYMAFAEEPLVGTNNIPAVAR